MRRKSGAVASIFQASLVAVLLTACGHSFAGNEGKDGMASSNSPIVSSPSQATDKPSSAPDLASQTPVKEAGGNAPAVLVNSQEPAPSKQPKVEAESRDSDGEPSAEASSKPKEDSDQSPKPVDERPLDPNDPQLAGIRLGDSEASVTKQLGAVQDEYDLPDGNDLIRMKDYSGVTVGFDDESHVVYVELTDSGSSSGIQGIGLGLSGQKAADALGVTIAPEDLLLLLEVKGGLYKIDLDPATRNTLSVKLIGQS